MLQHIVLVLDLQTMQKPTSAKPTKPPTWMSIEIGSWPLHFTRKYPKIIYLCGYLQFTLESKMGVDTQLAQPHLCHLKPTWLEPATQPHCTPVVAGQGLAPVGLCTIDDSVNNDSTLRYSTRRIHVWYISTYICLNFYGKSVGKYTYPSSHGCHPVCRYRDLNNL